MRLIRSTSIATIIALSMSFMSIHAQDTNIDALLSELSFDSGAPADASTAEPVVVTEEVTETSVVTTETEPAAEPLSNLDDLFTEPAPVAEETAVADEAVAVPDATEPQAAAADDSDAPAAEEAPAEKAEVKEPAVSKAEARQLAQQEEVRRQAREVQGQKSYSAGKAAYAAGDFEQAVKLLEDAQLNIPVRPANTATLEDIRVTLGEAYTEVAREKMESDINFARRNIDQALKVTPENRKAQSVEKKVTAREKRIAAEVARPKSVSEQPKYSEKYKSINDLLREGRDLFDAGELNDAELAFERVLILDEYNIEAMRFLRKIEDQRFKLRTKERETTVAEMMAQVRDTWNPPIRTDVIPAQGRGGPTQIDTISDVQKLQKKMEGIIIPSIEFRQANITDVVNFLVDASVAGDPDGVGVNIILKLASGSDGAAAPAAPVAAPSDDFGFGGDFSAPSETVSSAPASGVAAITLNLRRINLLDAIKYITEVADLRYRLEGNVVIITPANVVSGRVITRMYPVQPSILDVIVEREETDATARTGEFVEMGSARTAIRRSDVKEFFERAGVPFPAGTSITYNQSISQLIVANTAENLESFERILARLNVIPNQVEIEARFVEVNQTDLEELGFQWFLTDDWEIAQRQGSGLSPASTESIVARADADGFSKGLRGFAANPSAGTLQPVSTPLLGPGNTPLGGIMSFASILTNPEVTMVINALNQKGGTDLLSAPRVTTRSGVNAQIQVVQEIIYPVEFTSESVGGDVLNSVSIAGGTLPGTTPGTVNLSAPSSIIVYPDTFNTREVGVILNVTPTVGPDGYTIDLTLVPEVSELIDWIQYGQDPFNIPQPIFGSRKVTTSVVVWDGQTVVLGGLIREDLVKYDDKIPLLGDIPVLGRLFRSKGEYSQKKNLLIFVTARLVGPDGKPIQRGEAAIAEGAEVANP